MYRAAVVTAAVSWGGSAEAGLTAPGRPEPCAWKESGMRQRVALHFQLVVEISIFRSKGLCGFSALKKY